MQREAHFLNFRPSLIAAASLLFAINISLSEIAPLIDLKQIQDSQLENLFIETTIYMEITGAETEEKDTKCPLHMWNTSV